MSPGMNTMAIAMLRLVRFGPSSATMLMASTIGGNVKSASVARLIDRVGPTPEVSGNESQRHGNPDREHHGLDGGAHRQPGGVDQPAQRVATEVVGAEPVLARRTREHVLQVQLVGVIRRDDGSEDRHEDDEHDEARPRPSRSCSCGSPAPHPSDSTPVPLGRYRRTDARPGDDHDRLFGSAFGRDGQVGGRQDLRHERRTFGFTTAYRMSTSKFSRTKITAIINTVPWITGRSRPEIALTM